MGSQVINHSEKSNITKAVFKIVVGTTLLAIVYGVIHDMFTAHVQVEYFTEFHPRLLDSDSPIAQALFWGVIATWWMGAIIGAGLGAASQWGSYPTVDPKRVLKLIAINLVLILLVALVVLFGLLPLAQQTDPIKLKDQKIFICLFVHSISYFGCALLALVLMVRLILERRRMAGL